MKIVRLEIDPNEELAGIDAVALVEQPAIEQDFLMFNKESFASYDDYPQVVKDNAAEGIKLNEEQGNKCGTQVGKVRAQQLAQGKPISEETIVRMRSFLIRQKDNYDLAVSRGDKTACGYISYQLWGGENALTWAERKLKSLGYEFKDNTPEGEGKSTEANQEFDGLEDACWPGYVAIGTKIKDGREVPNCVPESDFKNMIIEKIIEAEMSKFSHHDEDEKKYNKYFDNLSDEIRDILIDKLEDIGIPEDELETQGYTELSKEETEEFIKFAIASKPDDPTVNTFESTNRKILYKYEGPKDSKNRDFCAKLLSKNLVFRKEDINQLSINVENKEFGFYDIFQYKGSYNCRHTWKPKLYKLDTPVSKQKRAKTNPASTIGGGIRNILFAREELDEKQMLVGPLMAANKLIRRYDEFGEEYYVYFNPETIEMLAHKMMKDGLLHEVNIEHNQAEKVDGVYLVESWIVNDPTKDKALTYGYTPNKGDWYGIYKVANQEIWNDYVKSGKVKGFSVEGYFANRLLSASKLK